MISIQIMFSLISLSSFFFNFCIARRLRVCWSLCHNSKVILTEAKHLPGHLQKELKTIFFRCFCYLIILVISSAFIGKNLMQRNLLIFLITLLIWIGIFFLKKLTESEILYLTSVNNLFLGYGNALWYFKNYLDKILPNFDMQLNRYENKEMVDLPHKLYILCPKSCKITDIDRSDYIELTKNPPFEIDHGGIVGREYSVSVYRIRCRGEIFRCALEYAQPLKNLLYFKNEGKISLSTMYIERESFIKNLTLMLKDPKNSFCELVVYDDEKHQLNEILSDLPSVKAFKCQTKE